MTASKELLKVQYGNVYVQVPVDDKDSVKFAIDFLLFMFDKIESAEKQPKETLT